MARRVTVLLDDDLYEKIIKLQAKQITSSNHSVSFSRVINQKLSVALKK